VRRMRREAGSAARHPRRSRASDRCWCERWQKKGLRGRLTRCGPPGQARGTAVILRSLEARRMLAVIALGSPFCSFQRGASLADGGGAGLPASGVVAMQERTLGALRLLGAMGGRAGVRVANGRHISARLPSCGSGQLPIARPSTSRTATGAERVRPPRATSNTWPCRPGCFDRGAFRQVDLAREKRIPC
jgi:hypothetical protein